MKKTLLAIFIGGIVLLVLSYFIMSLSQETKSLTNEERKHLEANHVTRVTREYFSHVDSRDTVQEIVPANDKAASKVFHHREGKMSFVSPAVRRAILLQNVQ